MHELSEEGSINQINYYRNMMENMILDYAPSQSQFINVTCVFIRQSLTEDPLQNPPLNFLDVDFRMIWESIEVGVSIYPRYFLEYMNTAKGLNRTKSNLQSAGVRLETVEKLRFIAASPTRKPTPIPVTSAPTTTLEPTSSPSMSPAVIQTNSPTPQITKTTLFPTHTITNAPTGLSSVVPSTAPTMAPKPVDESSQVVVIATASSVGATILIFIMGLFSWRRRRKNNNNRNQAFGFDSPNISAAASARMQEGDMESQARDVEMVEVIAPKPPPPTPLTIEEYPPSPTSSARHRDYIPVPARIPSRDSSLISPGASLASDSILEKDETNILADEFDQYKNPDLEKMRFNVERGVANASGMMSQALTRALIMNDDTDDDSYQSTAGGDGDQSSVINEGTPAEIEASVLCDTTDWLKRKESSSTDARRDFLQYFMNKMVASVRHGLIKPEDASRTIHECAAILGLQLAEEMEGKSVLVTGMRKTVKTENMVAAMKEFGDIESAAVAPRPKGFGLVRYKSTRSVQRALEKVDTDEIVVQDVAVMVRLISSPQQDYAQTQPQSAPPYQQQQQQLHGERGIMAAHHQLHSLDVDNVSLGRNNRR